MKKKLFSILIYILIIQCQVPKEKNIDIKFTIDVFDVAKNQMEVTFELTNSSDEIWKGGDWSLHWNQFSGSLQQSTLPEGIEIIPTKNSQYWQLNFDSSFTLKPGSSLKFSGIQKGIMRRLVMGPVGFFIHNSNNNQLHDLNSEIFWKNAEGLELLNIPSAAERYLSYEGISTLPKDSLHWVIPTPQKIKLQNIYRDLPDSLSIDFGEFNLNTDFLIRFLQKGLMLPIVENKKGSGIKIEKTRKIEKESYQLDISEKTILLKASDFEGVFYGLVSLHQILYSCQKEEKGIPLLKINDSPRFQHRGFMLDLSRNFFPKEKILEILDYMAYYKLNRLDLRLFDDEGWRLEIPGLKELTEISSKRGFTINEKDKLFPMYGSGSGKRISPGNGFLSRKDFVEILKIAEKRNITVIPQISFPSHARSAVIAMKARYENFIEQGNIEAANEFRLHDPNDNSEYTSAQLFKDNTICICQPSAFRFFDKIFKEIKAMYTEANLPMKTFNIGADELPFGVWMKSPLCNELLQKSSEINSFQELYNSSVKRINETITASGARMAGWEDVLLIHSEKSQSEIEVNKNLINLDFIPSVWNNTWGEGREDMIYKLANLGFKSIMSNSSAFYFDMADDKDMENSGLNWSGYVSYKDSWGTEPLNVFANKVKLKSLGIREAELKDKVFLNKNKRSNFLGIQSQLWTETATDSYNFDRMLMPNMIVFSERAWSPKEKWLEKASAREQEDLQNISWNLFVNTIGQRHMPMLSSLNEELLFDLPKPGGIIEKGMLRVRQQFPGLKVRYTLDGDEPDENDTLYEIPTKVNQSDQVVIRVFDNNGRGGNPIIIR